MVETEVKCVTVVARRDDIMLRCADELQLCLSLPNLMPGSSWAILWAQSPCCEATMKVEWTAVQAGPLKAGVATCEKCGAMGVAKDHHVSFELTDDEGWRAVDLNLLSDRADSAWDPLTAELYLCDFRNFIQRGLNAVTYEMGLTGRMIAPSRLHDVFQHVQEELRGD